MSSCDRCGMDSPEYAAWPKCAECGDVLCPKCSSHNRYRVVCVECREEKEEVMV